MINRGHSPPIEGLTAYRVMVSNVFGEDDISGRIREALKKVQDCIYAHIEGGIVTDSLSSCDDFAVHYQTYGNNPWGQGAALAALSVI